MADTAEQSVKVPHTTKPRNAAPHFRLPKASGSADGGRHLEDVGKAEGGAVGVRFQRRSAK